MNETWGVAIPGLAMAASEIPTIKGLIRLENPEIGDGLDWTNNKYTLSDIAEFHAKTIESLYLPQLTLIGMSMGGMIGSIMASRFRALLPEKTSFRLIVTSANLRANPAITQEMLAEWRTAQIGNIKDFRRILADFFSTQTLKDSPQTAETYFEYRSRGANKQKPQAFFRQVQAIESYRGEDFWPKIDPRELTVIGGTQDKILGNRHFLDLKKLSPMARFIEIENLGHMANLEMPNLFARHLQM